MADEKRIREVARELWEADGRPEDQQQRYWEMAVEIVGTEESDVLDTNLEHVGEIVPDEPPIIEEGLPLDEDESIIEENRLPLEPRDGEPDFDELPYRDDRDVAQNIPGSGSRQTGSGRA
ncbi:DUF2934 domain-containing protein [Billgrantia ethanolica]|uniref:DUF2934 domain-containing protein n=1 Tax=Billgrantia ethanolica TaxID=2733486 RepID=A0ABS9A414_9GAMM|nr:DUF2934 domain-containing protein [Halomonas ethanolica]MCE8003486.1 DUF2934 domain-containing protein [Halomonas ethanolica]